MQATKKKIHQDLPLKMATKIFKINESLGSVIRKKTRVQFLLMPTVAVSYGIWDGAYGLKHQGVPGQWFPLGFVFLSNPDTFIICPNLYFCFLQVIRWNS